MKALSEVPGYPHDLLASGGEALVVKKSKIRRFDIELRDHVVKPLQGAVIVAQHFRGNAVRFRDQPQQKMFSSCIILFVVSGCALGKAYCLLCAFRIVISH